MVAMKRLTGHALPAGASQLANDITRYKQDAEEVRIVFCFSAHFAPGSPAHTHPFSTQENVDEERHVYAHTSHGENEDSDGSPQSPNSPSRAQLPKDKEPLTPLMAKTSLHD
jgi:hypothetical protein